MTSISGALIDLEPMVIGGSSHGGVVGAIACMMEGVLAPVVTTYFKMRAQDSGQPPPGYVVWIATGAPDFAGTGYPGGDPSPVGPMILGSAVVAATWQV